MIYALCSRLFASGATAPVKLQFGETVTIFEQS